MQDLDRRRTVHVLVSPENKRRLQTWKEKFGYKSQAEMLEHIIKFFGEQELDEMMPEVVSLKAGPPAKEKMEDKWTRGEEIPEVGDPTREQYLKWALS